MPKQKTSKPKVPPPISPAKWRAMSPRQRLLAIAKDVLAQLDAKRFKPMVQDYIVTDEELELLDLSAAEVRERLLVGKKLANCRACAVGAMWLARVRLADGADGRDLFDYYDVRPEVGDDVSGLIECAFEQNEDQGHRVPGLRRERVVAQAIAFGERYTNKTTRMRRIFENIVAGRGTFNPARKARAAK